MRIQSLRRFRIALILIPLLLQPAYAQERSSASPGDHLFILSGQSNMTGQLKKGFATTVSEALGEDQVTIVHCMRSGRGIRFWVNDYELPEGHEFHGKLKSGNGEEYTRLLQAVKKAGDATEFQSVSFIWMQGESDANRDLGVAYAKSFRTLTGKLKADLSLEKMYFVIGRISDYGLHGGKADAWKRMRRIQLELAQDDPFGTWIDTDDLNGGDKRAPQGELHYPKEQSFQLGARFAEAALKQLSISNTTTINPHLAD